MSFSVYTGLYPGIDKITINQGDGLTAPQVVSAQSLEPHMIRINFDKPMQAASLTNVNNYYIADADVYEEIIAVQVARIGANYVDIHTEEQQNILYNISVSNVYDAYSNVIDASNNIADFYGSSYELNLTTNINSFWGMETGTQIEQFDFDTSPPVLLNQNPAHQETAISKSRPLITLDLVDTNPIVRRSIDVYIENQKVYDGTQRRFSYPWAGNDSSVDSIIIDGYEGFRVTLNYQDLPFDEFKVISVRVVAHDMVLNEIDETYWFRIQETVPPVPLAPLPTVGSTGLSRRSQIVSQFYDTQSGIATDSIRVYVNDELAYNGRFFLIPFDGPNSGLVPTIFDGYDGYTLTVERSGAYEPDVTVNVDITFRDKEDN